MVCVCFASMLYSPCYSRHLLETGRAKLCFHAHSYLAQSWPRYGNFGTYLSRSISAKESTVNPCRSSVHAVLYSARLVRKSTSCIIFLNSIYPKPCPVSTGVFHFCLLNLHRRCKQQKLDTAFSHCTIDESCDAGQCVCMRVIKL